MIDRQAVTPSEDESMDFFTRDRGKERGKVHRHLELITFNANIPLQSPRLSRMK